VQFFLPRLTVDLGTDTPEGDTPDTEPVPAPAARPVAPVPAPCLGD
jgi:hypothetical protein